MPRVRFTEEELRELYEQQRLSIRAIAKQKRVHPETIRDYLILFGIARRSVAEAKIKYPRRSFSGDAIEKAYLLGFRAGDLNVQTANFSPTSQTIIVACGTTRPEQVALFRSLFEAYGHVAQYQSSGQLFAVCYLDRSFDFLLEQEDRVPDWIIAEPCCFASFLAGYIDAEGCIQVKRQTRASEVIIRSYDKGILQACWTRLQELDIICPPIYLVQTKGARDADGPIYHGDYWGLGIYRQMSLLRLFTLIEPYMKHSKRRQDMLTAWKNIRAHARNSEETKWQIS
ncbi:MAG: hypothetical protein HZC40_08430 [Chloroflexi bacterium]|nr:hypothetical protein [Chloroflexota bacterium]